MILDISPPLSPQLAVWPGDVPLARQVAMQLKDGDNITLSSLSTTVHLGAHADAPSHYHQDGLSIEAVDLSPYLGPCTVVNALGVTRISVDHCLAAVGAGATRILFRTNTFPDPTKFNRDFASFSKEAVDYMGGHNVQLIGIDTPSVDPFSSEDLPAHQMLQKHNIRNLEGLVLEAVSPGDYELIALPLPLVGFDASPVRAILRSL